MQILINYETTGGFPHRYFMLLVLYISSNASLYPHVFIWFNIYIYIYLYLYTHTSSLIHLISPLFKGQVLTFCLRSGEVQEVSTHRDAYRWLGGFLRGTIRASLVISVWYKKGYSFIVGLIAVGVLPVARLCRTSGACRNAMDNLLSGPGLTIFWFYLCCFPRQWWDLWLDRDDWQMRRGNLKGLFPRAMTPGVDGFWEIQLTWDEFSRMRKRFDWPATLFAIHSACYRLASAASGKLPVLTEIGRSHFYDLALAVLELFSCWLASLACCLFVVDHQQPSVAKGARDFATGILGCGKLLGRSCYGAQTMARSRAIFPTPGVKMWMWLRV
jgi:hypothetical protein